MKKLTVLIVSLLMIASISACNGSKAAGTALGRDLITTVKSTNDVVQLKALLDEGADVNAKDNYGRTVLMSAVERNRVEMIKALLERGADVNAKDDMGKTALSRATVGNNDEVIKLLTEAGAK